MNCRMLAVLLLLCGAHLVDSRLIMAAETTTKSGCLTCHEGIEWIRDANSEMMKQIMALGSLQGDPQGCTVCHGGDPQVTDDSAAAHGGDFFADPGSSWITWPRRSRRSRRSLRWA